jgi:hypothetical protein
MGWRDIIGPGSDSSSKQIFWADPEVFIETMFED